MIGVLIRYNSNTSREFIRLMLHMISLEEYSWNVLDFTPLTEDRRIRNETCTADDILRFLDSCPNDMMIDSITMLGYHDAPSGYIPQSFDDFISGSCECILQCVGTYEFYVFHKDESVLKNLKRKISLLYTDGIEEIRVLNRMGYIGVHTP